MNISVERLAPAALPTVQPLQFLSPADLAPTSGVDAYSQGIRNGEALAAPIEQSINKISDYYQPQTIATRQAVIAQAGLATTNANQQNTAALATPNLPLSERQLEQQQVNSAGQILPLQTAATSEGLTNQINNLPLEGTAQQEQLTNNINNLPTAGKVEHIGLVGQEQEGLNKVETTPNAADLVDPATMSDADVQRKYTALNQEDPDTYPSVDSVDEMRQNLTPAHDVAEGAEGAAKAQSQEQRAVFTAGLPTATGNQRYHLENGKMVPTELRQKDVVGTDGTIQTVNIDPYSGEQVGDPISMSVKQATMNNANDRAAAIRGAYTGDDPTLKSLSDSASVILGPAQEALPAAVYTRAAAVANNVTKLPQIQLIERSAPSIDDAITNFQDSPESGSGVMTNEGLNQAARAFRGASPTEYEMNALAGSQGIPARTMNLYRSLMTGDNVAQGTKNDYITALQNLKGAYASEATKQYNAGVSALDKRAQPFAPQLFHDLAPFVPGVSSQIPSAAGTTLDTPGATAQQASDNVPLVSTKADYDKLPKGTKYVDPNGNVGTKG